MKAWDDFERHSMTRILARQNHASNFLSAARGAASKQ
jgi:hypothetical protein